MLAQLYNALWYAGLPAARLCSASARQRLSPAVPLMPAPPVWFQACSVGEINTVRPLLAAFNAAHPGIPALLSTSTPAGMAHAEEMADIPFKAFFPLDHPGSVRRFFDAVLPRALVLVETEIWPNVIREATRRGVPILLVNGRLSEKHMRRYQHAAGFFTPIFASITSAAMQDNLFAERIRALGTQASRVTVAGNMKFDAAPTDIPQKIRQRLRVEYGIAPGDRVIVFGSTRPGDEARAAVVWGYLRQQYPGLRMIVAPRHLDRVPDALAAFGGQAVTRSAMLSNARPSQPPGVIVLDTHGELVNHYALAELAVIGGSFDPEVNGHNPIEPAALGVPVLFGPCMKNFAAPAEILARGGGALQVDAARLSSEIARLLGDRGEIQRMGTRARGLVLEHRGATERNLRLITAALETPCART